ncbi:unnamed protein product, partial [Ectocarpus sp. 6 AP-2014]
RRTTLEWVSWQGFGYRRQPVHSCLLEVILNILPNCHVLFAHTTKFPPRVTRSSDIKVQATKSDTETHRHGQQPHRSATARPFSACAKPLGMSIFTYVTQRHTTIPDQRTV